ncbi:MAG: DNA-processing protein DprA [Bacteroidales bacterium]|nr:DNA-processing protein DprA [Bacteroidales bacterium]
MNDETLYSIALSSITGIGPCRAKEFVREFGSASAVYRCSPYELAEHELSKNAMRLFLDHRNESLATAEKEMKEMERLGISCYLFFDDNYPYRLRLCEDSPLVLFTNNVVDLNKEHYLSVVGTRNATDYGRVQTRSLIKQLAEICPNVTIVSGLAYGTDINAQQAALEYGLRTVSVVAHGLHTIYPSYHRSTAEMLTMQGGAVLSEYPTTTNATPKNFLQRNRIVAGMSDAVVVMESSVQGGSLSTANHALGYHRDVFAYPGRVGDAASEGCNALIKNQKAMLVTSADDIIAAMNWTRCEATATVVSSDDAFTTDELSVLTVLRQATEPMHFSVLLSQIGLPVHKLKSLLTKLEFQGVICQLAGEKFQVL